MEKMCELIEQSQAADCLKIHVQLWLKHPGTDKLYDIPKKGMLNS